MAMLDPVFPTLSAHLHHLATRAVHVLRWQDVATDTPEAGRARRAFVQDLICRDPEAFSSDLDIQTLMLHFPDGL